MFRLALLAVLCFTAPLARAHPHVFVDVGLSFETNGAGDVTAVEVTWRYDALFSLLVLSDRGLDSDGDMNLEEDEREVLLGFDLVDWPEGFDGALFLTSADGPVDLNGPEAISVTVDSGQIVTRHRRPLSRPFSPDGLIVRPFDPSYYAALSLSGRVEPPEGCLTRLEAPNKEAADAKVASLGGFDDEGVFEETLVGTYYADTLTLTCAQS
ncbi:DUF1007 family protein [Roseovarius aestuariivivens]|uniref:DUF1007 family protein n=1 Tax=Roseovarius aestuariivivens TaxID=1888910 RepID=UPI0010819998|nr:DUF1007 family protein [Roseovarius aestuariivivens]